MTRSNPFFKSRPNQPSIASDTTGFSIKENNLMLLHIRWSDVSKLAAFKRDDFTVDTLCIQVNTELGHSALLTEDMAGFIDFLERMTAVVPGIPTDWRRKVIPTAFAENYTLLFQKADSSSTS